MNEKYIDYLLIALIANQVYFSINKLGQAITEMLMNNLSFLNYLVTIILIFFIGYIMNKKIKSRLDSH